MHQQEGAATAIPSRPRRQSVATAVALGLLHAVVDTVSIGVLFAAVPDDAVAPIVLYNCLAFGLQPALGWAADRAGAYRPTALLGLAGLAAGLGTLPYHATAAIVLVAVGNALYHVGAGAIVLRQASGHAAEPGLYVAPGAAGLAVGVYLGSAGLPARWLLAGALAVGVALVASCRSHAHESATLPPVNTRGAPLRRSHARESAISPPVNTRGAPLCRSRAAPLAACVVLLLVSAAIRSLVGDALAGPWRAAGAGTVMIALTAAAVVGKAGGGVLADRVGWRISAVVALLLAVPLTAVAAASAPAAVAAVLLVQSTMAVTLADVMAAMPSRPALAFGLPSLAILAGTVPAGTGLLRGISPAILLPAAALLAAVTIYAGLRPAGEGKDGLTAEAQRTQR